ncbi:putative transporter, partial [Trachipleistophora hominis]
VLFKMHVIYTIIIFCLVPKISNAADLVLHIGTYVLRVVAVLLFLTCESAQIYMLRMVHLAIKSVDIGIIVARMVRAPIIGFNDMKRYIITLAFDLVINAGLIVLLYRDMQLFDIKLNEEIKKLERSNLVKLP